MLTNERLQFRDQLSGQAALEVGVEPQFDRLQPELLETGDLGLGERLVGELLERLAPPERQRLTEHERSRRRVDVGECSTLGDHPLEPDRVDLVVCHLDEVAGGPREQDRAIRALLAIWLERLAQSRHVDPQRVLLVDTAGVTPQLVEDLIGREHRVRRRQQQGEQGALSKRTEVDGIAVSQHLELAEYPILHPSSSRRPCPRSHHRVASVWTMQLRCDFDAGPVRKGSA